MEQYCNLQSSFVAIEILKKIGIIWGAPVNYLWM